MINLILSNSQVIMRMEIEMRHLIGLKFHNGGDI